MNLVISKLISSVIQIILFTFVPFIWWLITARKSSSFFEWIGLKRINGKESKPLFWILGISSAFVPISVFMLYILRNVESASSDFNGLGIKALPAIIIYAILNTALPEEILFRGFLLKRISNRFGFVVGNVGQAVIFGSMHGIMFFSMVGVMKAILITLFTGIIAWFMGFINEKEADGSILPSWCIHSIANIFSGLCSAFSMF
ncbi:MAG: CPBP family intramembrane metalloprotease [Ruminococcus sp.]|nr:CPBP family intramembrane metalloprotease [Ruminococcus sp.]